MDLNEKYEYWLNFAQYDLETAEAMFTSGRWFYVVFMCQQAVEKMVKGLYTLYVDDNVPKTHNIKKLVSVFESQLKEPMKDDYYLLFDTLSAHYLASRYPDFISEANNGIDKNTADFILKKTREAFKWLQTLKP